jgi:RNA polymerase sigma factor FliA
MPAERSTAKKKVSSRTKAAAKSPRLSSTTKATKATKKASTAPAKAGASKAASKKKAAKKVTRKAAASTTGKPAAKKATAAKVTSKKAAARKATVKAAPKQAAAKKASTVKAAKKQSTKKAAPKATSSKSTATRTSAAKRAHAAGSKTTTATASTATATSPRPTRATEPAAALPTDAPATSTTAGELMSESEVNTAEVDEIEEIDEVVDSVVDEDDDLPLDPISEVTTEDLWEQYGIESTALLTEIATDLGLPIDAPEVTSKKRGLTSPELERLRNELIERHYPLVRYIAERLLQTLPKSIELDDLISAGQFGLMDAIRGFDPERGIKFKTYCSTRIRGSILDQLRSQDWVPRLVRIKWSRIERALQQLTGEFGREPTHSELARVLDMSHDELSKELGDAQAKAMFSLSEKWDDDDDGSVEKVEILEDHESIDPVRELNRRDLMKFITRALTHKERFIIEQYYQYGHTMREIGEMLALTESRVCQIHSNVMGRLKGLLQKRESSLES